jgi:hypothetical protein
MALVPEPVRVPDLDARSTVIENGQSSPELDLMMYLKNFVQGLFKEGGLPLIANRRRNSQGIDEIRFGLLTQKPGLAKPTDLLDSERHILMHVVNDGEGIQVGFYTPGDGDMLPGTVYRTEEAEEWIPECVDFIKTGNVPRRKLAQ